MKKFICILTIAGLIITTARAQESPGFTYEGVLKSSGTFSTGSMLKRNFTNLYLTGALEYYVDERVSVISESFIFLNSIEDNGPFKMNHALFSGVNYHLMPNSSLDPYVGLEPGITMTQSKSSEGVLYEEAYNPMIAASAGVNYFALRWFHLFLNVKYQKGNHVSSGPSIPLDELKFTFGLGWNVRVKKM